MPLLPPVRRIDPNFPGLGAAVLIVLGILGMQIAVFVPVMLWAAVTQGGVAGMQDTLFNPWVLGGANLIALGSVILFCLRYTGESARRFFALRPVDPRILAPVVVASIGLGIVLDQIDNVIVHTMRQFPQLAEVPLDLAVLARFPLGSFLTLVIIAPLTEEYAVRGLILRGLLRRHAPAIAILVSAVMFGAMHANFRQFIVGLVTGGVFGWWYYRTGSVAPTILAHAVFNGVATLGLLYPAAVPYLGRLDAEGAVVFQPWWFTLGGALAAGGGLLWFDATAEAAPVETLRPVPEAEPPIIAPESEPPVIPTEPTPSLARPEAQASAPGPIAMP